MQNDQQLSKVRILLNQGKYKEAESILSDLLSQDPNDEECLLLLSESFLGQGKTQDARTIINTIIGQHPDFPHLYYVRATISLEEEKLGEAEEDLLQAIRLEPRDADYFALLAHIELVRKNFDQANTLAEEALEIDATNLLALNTRSTALLKLDQKEASFQTIEGALREDPNNAYTHTNYGWGLLEKGEHKKALEHFKEALQNDPTYEYAQGGMLEAIKATNPVYRLFLKYVFFMDNLTSKYQWGVIIGFYLVYRLLNRVADANPTLEPFLTPIIYTLAFIAFSTWIITPISNLFLRFNTYGKLLLNKKEKMSSNLVAASLMIAIYGLIAYFVAADASYLSITAVGVMMMLPLSVVFLSTKYSYALPVYTVGLAFFGILFMVTAITTSIFWNDFAVIFILGIFIFQWVANFLITDNRAV